MLKLKFNSIGELSFFLKKKQELINFKHTLTRTTVRGRV